MCFLTGDAPAEKDETGAFKEVMPNSVTFKPQLRNGKVAYYTAYDNQNKLTGFIIKSAERGYSSIIEAVAGLNLDLKITDIKILSQRETPGLGAKIKEASFLDQFKGKNADSLNEVDSITGATISSTTLINSLKNKIVELKYQLLRDVRDAPSVNLP
jgi:electron transport complex protein RnfG